MIIATYNSAGVIVKCLESLRASFEDFAGEVVIVDNNSSDRTVSLAKENSFCTTKVLAESKNLGFAKACNEGVRVASSKYVCLLNPDVFVRPGWLAPLVDVLEKDPLVAAVVPHVYREDGTVESVGTFIRYPPPQLEHLFYKASDIIEVSIVGFACTLFPRIILESFPLDQKMFLYNEDFDFCIRAKMAGYKLALCGGSAVVHVGGHSGATWKLQLRAEAYFNRTILKCAPLRLAAKGLFLELVGIGAGVKNRNPWYTYQKCYGLGWPILNLPVAERIRTLGMSKGGRASLPIVENSFSWRM